MVISEALNSITRMLKRTTEDADFEAKEIMCFALAKDRTFIYQNSDMQLDFKTYKNIIKLVNKRKTGYPLQFILGEWDFYGRTFKVGEGVLIPRSDTEVLAQKAIDILKDKENPSVLDLCSGSGCLAITIKKELLSCDVTAVERSDEALNFLKENAALNDADINIVKDDVLNPAYDYKKYDVILSNPPYLTKDDMEHLQTEVQYEPEMALYGGEDGLYFYKKITQNYKSMLKENGVLMYEIGMGQGNAVSEIMKMNGFKTICHERDLCDIIRVLYSTL